MVLGWINYYGKFYPSELKGVLNYVSATLVRWAMGRYKKLRGAATFLVRASIRTADWIVCAYEGLSRNSHYLLNDGLFELF